MRKRKPMYPDPVAIGNSIVESLQTIPRLFDDAYDLVGHADLEQQDLLHEIELLSLTKKTASEVLHALRENRLMRREAKDFMYVAKPLYDFIQKNKRFLDELAAAVRQMEKNKNTLKDRMYVPRVRHESMEAFIQLTAQKSGKSSDELRELLKQSGVIPEYDESDSGASTTA